MFKPNTRFHVFTIVRLLGMGGVAEVYLARYKGKDCALKVLQRRFALDDTQLARAQREATVLTRIHHTNVIDVQDAGVHDGIFWMRMEFIEGIDLRTAIHRLAPMSVGLAAAWIVQAAYGAHQCHAFGVIHRDIKPENAFITIQNIVKLIDLGIAKIYGDLNTIQDGRGAPPIGTAPYMSPEQARGEYVTPASDVYALAITFWEMVVGEHPFLMGGAAYDYWTMLHKQVHEDVPPLTEHGLPPEISDLISRSLSKRWQDRPSSALAFAKELMGASVRFTTVNPQEAHPGEPAVRELLEELMRTPPSFGTGPQPARSSGLPRAPNPRTAQGLGPVPAAVLEAASKPRTAQGLGSSAVAASIAVPRFHTHTFKPIASGDVDEEGPTQPGRAPMLPAPGGPAGGRARGRFGTERLPALQVDSSAASGEQGQERRTPPGVTSPKPPLTRADTKQAPSAEETAPPRPSRERPTLPSQARRMRSTLRRAALLAITPGVVSAVLAITLTVRRERPRGTEVATTAAPATVLPSAAPASEAAPLASGAPDAPPSSATTGLASADASPAATAPSGAPSSSSPPVPPSREVSAPSSQPTASPNMRGPISVTVPSAPAPRARSENIWPAASPPPPPPPRPQAPAPAPPPSQAPHRLFGTEN
jgi:serine/threonine-protein kinase